MTTYTQPCVLRQPRFRIAISKAWLRANAENAFLLLVLCGALFDISVWNFGLNLRLTTVSMLLFFFLYAKRLKIVPTFLIKHKVFALALFAFEIVPLISILNADVPFLAIKQTILYFLLFFNIPFFLMQRTSENRFAKVFLTAFVGITLIVDVYATLQPIIAFKSGRFNLLRPSGFFEQPNMFGLLNVMTFGYLAGIYLCRSMGKWMLRLSILSITLLFPVFLLAFNRGSYVGVLVQIACVAVLFPGFILRNLKRIIGVFLLLALLLACTINFAKSLPAFHGKIMMFDYAVARVSSLFTRGLESDASWEIRMKSVGIAMEHFKKHPILGAGMANSVIESPRLARKLIESGQVYSIRQSNEVMPIDVLAESGLAGLATSILFWIMILGQALRNISVFAGFLWERALAIGSFLATTGMLVNGMSSSPLTSHYFWINVGIVVYLWRLSSKRREGDISSNSLSTN